MSDTMIHVDMGDDIPLANAKCARPDVYRFLKHLVQEAQDLTVSPPDLLAIDTLPNGKETPRYELRHRRMAIGERGIVGAVTLSEMEKALAHRWKQDLVGGVIAEQPDIRWELVAAEIVRDDRLTTVFQEASVSQAIPAFQVPTDESAYIPNTTPGRRLHEQVVDHWIVIEAAFAGLGGQLVDQSEVPTPMRTYIQTRHLVDLPLAHRKQRKKAIALIERRAAKRAEALDPVLAGAEAGKELTELQVKGAAMMFRGGMKWPEIAVFFGTTHQKIRGAVMKAGLLDEDAVRAAKAERDHEDAIATMRRVESGATP